MGTEVDFQLLSGKISDDDWNMQKIPTYMWWDKILPTCAAAKTVNMSWQRDETALISTGHHLFLPNSFIFQNPVVHIQPTVAASVWTETDPRPLQEIISFSKLQVWV